MARSHRVDRARRKQEEQELIAPRSGSEPSASNQVMQRVLRSSGRALPAGVAERMGGLLAALLILRRGR
mgnify:CR=1 FL=1